MKEKRSRKKVVVAASIALVLAGGAAFAYWAMRGDGTGSVTTQANGQTLVVEQTAPGPMAPGDQITLSGTIRNPNSTSVRLGVLSAALGDTGGIDAAEFKLGGTSSSDSVTVAGNSTLAWSGLTLKYVDSPTVNQNAGKGVTVKLNFSLSQYTERAGGYNAIPDEVLGNVPSQAFQATQTTEFGDAVGLSGASRTLKDMSVLFSSWGCQSGGDATCQTTAGATFMVPVTFTIYKADAQGKVLAGDPLARKTQDVNFAFRPSVSAQCKDTKTPNGWYDATTKACYNGSTQLVKMTMPANTLTDNVVWTVKYNTSNYGDNPTGVTGGWDSLNVGAKSFPGAPFAGTDLNEDLAFLTSTSSAQTADGWTGYRPLGAITTK